MGGPCSAWVTLGAAQADPLAVMQNGDPLDAGILLEMIDVASELLWAHSGRQFSGVCADTVRPLSRVYAIPASQWASQWRWYWSTHTCSRSPERGGGCWILSEITLGAYPLRSITEVRVDGAVIDPADYRIDDDRWLVRIDPAGNGWPCCQDLSLPVTDQDTFEVSFLWGKAPPVMGQVACRHFAIELAKAASGDPCMLPQRLQSFVVQQATYQLLDPMNFLDKGRTGIYLVDQFLRAVNPNGLARRSMFISPDIGRPVRRTSTSPGS